MGARRPNLQARAAQQAKLTSSVFKLSIRNLLQLTTIYSHCAGTDCVHAGEAGTPTTREVFLHWKNNTRTICFRLTYEA